MSSMSEQHASWTAGFKILLPSGATVEKLLRAVERTRDEKTGKLVDLTDEQGVHQTLHAVIVRLWSKSWTDYTLQAGVDIIKKVIPVLEARLAKQGVDIKLVWGENVWFKRVQVNSDGDILRSSAPRGTTAEQLAVNPDLAYMDAELWNGLQGYANTACYTVSLVDEVETVVVDAGAEKPLELDFLAMDIPAAKTKAKKTATK